MPTITNEPSNRYKLARDAKWHLKIAKGRNGRYRWMLYADEDLNEFLCSGPPTGFDTYAKALKHGRLVADWEEDYATRIAKQSNAIAAYQAEVNGLLEANAKLRKRGFLSRLFGR